MNEIDKTILTDQTKFRLNEISQTENYFNSEISQRKTCEKLSKSVTAFDYVDEILIVLSATTGRVFIVPHATVVGAPVGIASAGFTIVFSLAKKNYSAQQETKRKSMMKFLCWLKVNSIALKL